jgi:hypothetical protein
MPHLAVLFPAALLLARPHLADRRLDPPRAHFQAGCAASVRRARSGNCGRPADPGRQGSHVSSRADLGNRQVDVRPRVARHDLPAALLAGLASQPGDCTAGCWSSHS